MPDEKPKRAAWRVDICPVDSGEFVVARNGFWLPGVYADEVAAGHAATLEHGYLDDLWLSTGRALHLIDGELRPAA